MRLINIGDHSYRIDTLDAIKQFHITRRLAPIMAALMTDENPKAELSELMVRSFGKVAEALAHMTDEDCNYVLRTCLGVVSRKQVIGQQETWAQVWSNAGLMFQDLKMPDMIQLTLGVIEENLGDFFPIALLGSEEVPKVNR